MIIDKDLKFCDNQTVSSMGGGNDPSADNVDLGEHFKYDGTTDFGSETPDIGESEELELNVKVNTTALAGTTLQIDLYHSATGGSSATVISSGAVLMTKSITIGAGQAIGVALVRDLLPAGTINRYLALLFTDPSTDISTGAVSAWIAGRSETPK